MISLQLLLVRKDTGKDVAAVVENLKEMLKGADESTFSRITKENTEGPNASRNVDSETCSAPFMKRVPYAKSQW